MLTVKPNGYIIILNERYEGGVKMYRKLIAKRAEEGYTQTQVAEYLGIANSTYRDKESGRREFNLSEALKLAKLFNITVEELFFTKECTKQLNIKKIFKLIGLLIALYENKDKKRQTKKAKIEGEKNEKGNKGI